MHQTSLLEKYICQWKNVKISNKNNHLSKESEIKNDQMKLFQCIIFNSHIALKTLNHIFFTNMIKNTL